MILFTVIMGLIGGFQYFTQAYVMTGGTGGAGDAALFYCLYLFQKAFNFQDMGGASAMAWMLFIVILAVTLLTFRVSRQFEPGNFLSLHDLGVSFGRNHP